MQIENEIAHEIARVISLLVGHSISQTIFVLADKTNFPHSKAFQSGQNQFFLTYLFFGITKQ
jgi:hypothetical protein